MTLQQNNKWCINLSPEINQCQSFSIFRQILKNQGYEQLFHNKNTHISKRKIEILTFQEYQSNHKDKNNNVIQLIIKDLYMSDAAVFALSGQLNTFGQDSKSGFVPYKILDLVIANSLAIFVLQLIGSKLSIANNRHSLSVIDLAKYMGAFNITAKQSGLLANPLGQNYLDGGAPFYRLYQCQYGGTVAVGNLQLKFYEEMLKGLDLSSEVKEFMIDSHADVSEWPKVKQILTNEFLKKNAKQWEKIMNKFDTCVTQVQDFSFSIHEKQPKVYPLIRPKL